MQIILHSKCKKIATFLKIHNPDFTHFRKWAKKLISFNLVSWPSDQNCSIHIFNLEEKTKLLHQFEITECPGTPLEPSEMEPLETFWKYHHTCYHPPIRSTVRRHYHQLRQWGNQTIINTR